jgi:hypothetical protein
MILTALLCRYCSTNRSALLMCSGVARTLLDNHARGKERFVNVHRDDTVQ